MYQYRALTETSLEQIAQCFNSAFSDYEQPIRFTPESLRYYLTASAVDLSLSFGAFRGEEPVGFILNSSGMYHGRPAVFDAGTGVIPEHRGKGVFSALFDFTCRQLRHRGIAKYYLEVLQTNHRAVAIYRGKGFSVSREYSVLTAGGAGTQPESSVRVIPFTEFETFSTGFSVAPSFEHTSDNIRQNPQLYEVLCLDDLAYCIYAKRNGEIIQMHYHTLEALKAVMSALIHRYPSAMAKNVDCGCPDVIQMLRQIGFTEILKQYEMVRDII